MNLVAKEFVSARDDERGVLVLSQFAGAAQQLRGALVVDPCASTSALALWPRRWRCRDMEQASRMRVLRANVETFDASWWADALLQDAMGARRDVPSVARRKSRPAVPISA